jgi:protein SCO1/2
MIKHSLILITLTTLFTSLAIGAPREVEGVIESVDREAMKIQLRTSEAADSVLSAMVGRGDARILEAGDRVRGELVRFGEGHRLQTIWPNEPAVRGAIAQLGQRLRRDTLQRGSKVFRGVGEYLPKFALYDTDGSLFLSESLKGNFAVMNFIFTRCANPRMCPASTARMFELQQMAAEAGWDDFVQVSVTLDAEYDTPGIFTAYAMDKGIDTATFHLLGGPAGIVEDLKKQMGVLAEPDEEEIIRHTMSTALIDPTGKIIYRIPGSMWSPEAFIKQVRRAKEQ